MLVLKLDLAAFGAVFVAVAGLIIITALIDILLKNK